MTDCLVILAVFVDRYPVAGECCGGVYCFFA